MLSPELKVRASGSWGPQKKPSKEGRESGVLGRVEDKKELP
jgi:hypothetical protein